MTTYSASVDCTDSAIPTCSGDVCVAMSCGGGSFTPNGAYDSLWDSIQDVLQQVDPPDDEFVPIDSTCELVETSQESLPQTPWIWKCFGALSTTTAGF